MIIYSDKEIIRKLNELKNRIGNIRPILSSIGETVRSSVVHNFTVGGRPSKWDESKRVLLSGGQTLKDTGRLVNSINWKVFDNKVEIGTNVKYAAELHYGRKDKKLPARPFLLIHNEDKKEFLEIIQRKLMTFK